MNINEYRSESEQARMNHLNLTYVTARLSFSPRDGAKVSDDIFDQHGMLMIPIHAMNDVGANLIRSHLPGVTTFKFGDVSVRSDESYHVINTTTKAIQSKMNFKSVEEIAAVLANPHLSICSKLPVNGAFKPLLNATTDLKSVVITESKAAAWADLICAVVNQNIEESCDWSTDGLYDASISAALPQLYVKSQEEEVPLADYAVSYILRTYEPVLNRVFEYTRSNPRAFHHATPSAQGIRITTYADVRAFERHYQQQELADSAPVWA